MSDYSIAFPNLHIELAHVGKSISVFGFEIAYYGIVISLGMLLGVSLVFREAKRIGVDEERCFTATILALVFGVIGARIYYVAFSWDMYKDNLPEIFNIRQGGLAIYGGILSAVLVVWIYTKVHKMSFLHMADAMCLGVLVGQILGRWGNFFNREAFGDYTDSLFAMRLPVSAVRTSDLTESLSAHIVDGYIQVHPTFLYESAWNLLLLIGILVFRRHAKFHGQVFAIYLFGYGVGRFLIEGLRTDQLLIPGTGIPVSQVVSVALILTSVGILLAAGQKKGLRNNSQNG